MACYINPNNVITFDALTPYVLPYTRGCPDQLVLHNIRLSTIEFCRRSGILHDIQKYDTQAKVNDYQLTTECGYGIARVFRVTMNDTWDYQPVNVKLTRGSGGYLFHMTSPTIIHLRTVPAQDTTLGLEVETVVVPKQDSSTLDNYLYEMWGEAIAAGAIGRILSIPQTNWYDPQLAGKYEKKFRQELTRCRAEIDRAFSTKSMMKAERWVGSCGSTGGIFSSGNPGRW